MDDVSGWEGCTRGMGGLGAWEGLYRVLPSTLPGTILQPYSASGPYLRPNEGLSEVPYEVS